MSREDQLRQRAIDFTERWFDRKWNNGREYQSLMEKMVQKLMETFSQPEPNGAPSDVPQNILDWIGTSKDSIQWCEELKKRIRDSFIAAPQSAVVEMMAFERLAAFVNETNDWRNEFLLFVEVAPVISSSGSIDQIGKVQGWRVGFSYGRNLDEIDHGFNYFGRTPLEAIEKVLAAAKGGKG